MAVRRRAFALILVLVVAGATFALAIQGAVAVRSATVEASAMRDRAQARREALSVATIVLASLTSGAKSETDVIGGGSSGGSTTPDIDEDELPDMPPEMRELVRGLLRNKPQSEDGESTSSQRAATQVRRGGPFTALRQRGLAREALRARFDEREYRISLIDAAGGLHLNVAEEDQLVRYFRAVGVDGLRATSLAQELLDWRDDDNVPRTRGAERDAYLRRNVTPRNGDLQTLEELLFLPSMSRDLFDRIRSDLTLLGEGEIHAPTASRAVLLSAPGLTEQAADRILALRAAGHLNEETLDEALGALSHEAKEAIRLQPSSTIALRIEPAEEGPAYRIEAAISDERGVQLLDIRMISRD